MVIDDNVNGNSGAGGIGAVAAATTIDQMPVAYVRSVVQQLNQANPMGAGDATTSHGSHQPRSLSRSHRDRHSLTHLKGRHVNPFTAHPVV